MVRTIEIFGLCGASILRLRKTRTLRCSHQFWTIIALKGVEEARLRAESPTTNSWFDAAHVLGREGPHWNEFRARLAGIVGIALPP